MGKASSIKKVTTLKVELRAVSDLLPYAHNARTHTDEQVAQIAASIEEWGWTTPVLVDEKGLIIAGHGRVSAAQLLKIKKVPVMVAKGWSEAQKRAYSIADNKLALNASWDNGMLAAEFGDLADLDFNLDLLGFDMSPDYAPDLNPVMNGVVVTDEQVAAAGKKIMGEYKNKSGQTIIDVECPYCEKAFGLNKDAL